MIYDDNDQLDKTRQFNNNYNAVVMASEDNKQHRFPFFNKS